MDEGKNTFACEEGETKDEEMVGGDMGLHWWSDSLLLLLEWQMIDGYAPIFSNLYIPSRTRCANS
jgi:hypothetical protein